MALRAGRARRQWNVLKASGEGPRNDSLWRKIPTQNAPCYGLTPFLAGICFHFPLEMLRVAKLISREKAQKTQKKNGLAVSGPCAF